MPEDAPNLCTKEFLYAKWLHIHVLDVISVHTGLTIEVCRSSCLVVDPSRTKAQNKKCYRHKIKNISRSPPEMHCRTDCDLKTSQPIRAFATLFCSPQYNHVKLGGWRRSETKGTACNSATWFDVVCILGHNVCAICFFLSIKQVGHRCCSNTRQTTQ